MEATAVNPVTGPTQDEIRRQIELLQAQLNHAPAAPLSPPSRKQNIAKVLAPSTPSPKKRKVHHDHMSKPLVVKRSSTATKKPLPAKQEPAQTAAPTPSTFLSGLGAVNARGKGEEVVIPRSTAFSQKAATPVELAHQPLAPERDDRLALVEDLEPGPYDHKPPFDDPNFEKLEPNSGIHLKTRNIPHEDLQEHLRGRFFLSPSRLYSVIRLSPNKQAYDVPVAGDWVTIAVVAERGPIKITNGGSSTRDDEDDEKPPGPNSKKPKALDPKPRKPTGKKYMHLKLVDFGRRSRTSSTSKATIKGDALLSLLLFESDTFDRITAPDGSVKKLYRGGSRGAFEELSKLKEGSVIALLNPKVLRPFQNKSSDTPHPVTNILALTPESAQSIEIIGMSRDLGMCAVLKRDGKACGGWCDKRISEVCDYHVQTAVQSRRAARPEFSIGTSGMSTTAAGKRKDYDPARQWGLKPEEKPGGSRETYVLSGHVVSSRGPDYVHEKIGREGQAKAKRKLDQVETERTLQQLLSSNGGQDNAAEAVKRARLAIQSKKASAEERSKGKRKDNSDADLTPDNEPGEQTRRAYPAEIVKKLGFDPTLKAGQKRLDTKSGASRKLGVLRGDVHLGPPPGPRIRSGVIAPECRKDSPTESFIDSGAHPTDNLSDDDLEVAERAAFGNVVLPARRESGAVPDVKTEGGDDDGDSDLEIESPP
ncbi:hypothetical protein BD410DRAFT_763043 [Rickenella mellea]|uniref:Zinc finger Mcm10/DnaG-type domain-containing protein n=1 Tax=Rickenella mellea TaxID=50990 RepID=A0A4Y7QHZ3_9AGAM|nr:hypothetical protein BD410DRAFT_763043 [Rickenella mellea]